LCPTARCPTARCPTASCSISSWGAEGPVERLFSSAGGVGIWGHVARPRSAPGTWTPGVVLCHGFPPGRSDGRLSARSFPELADRIATELGWVILVICCRGCGDSEGDFSMGGWLSDARASSDYLHDVEGV